MNNQKIKELKNIALSDSQILNLVSNDANLILYPDMHKYTSIDQILEPHGAAIILYESKPSYGHWVCVFKVSENEIEYFNSYGDSGNHEGLPDAMLNYIPENFRNKSNQNHTYLAKLMCDSKYDLSYNQYHLQSDGPGIKTCGRHVGTRLNNRNMNLDEYYRFLKKYCKEFNTDFDGAVCILTRQIN
jgi:hypothetical protein